jgi:type I restriction enzyme, S subunit
MKTEIQKYAAYKDSGVDWLGEIPSHWEVIRLKYIFTILKRIVGELGHNVLSITQTGIKVKDTESGEGQLSMDYSKYQIVKKGDYAMNHMDLLTGYVDISKYDGVISPDYRVFELTDSNSFKSYMLLLLQLGYRSKIFYAHGQGVSMLGRWRFPAESFNAFIFPIPPKEEQTAISAFLDRKTALIDQAIDIKQKQIELLKERRQILIHKAVTRGVGALSGVETPNLKLKDSGVEWIGEIPEGWEVLSFRHCIETLTDFTSNGSFASLASNVTYLNEGYSRLIRLTDLRVNLQNDGVYVSEKSHKFLSNSELFGGELLIANVGAYAGLAEIMPKLNYKTTLGPNMLLLKLNQHNPYFAYLINSPLYATYITNIATATAQPKLNKENIRNLRIIRPPIDEQKRIVKSIESFSIKFFDAISLKEQEIEKLKEYKATLINSAVTGKIKVGLIN